MNNHLKKIILVVIVLANLVIGLKGIGWGLYGPLRQQCLHDPNSLWSEAGDIDKLLGETSPDHESVGADVDPNPRNATVPLCINETPRDIAEIYARFLLYSQQPDEMITFRALSRMQPSKMAFDPGLYQYGGLFIYPIGFLVKMGDWLGLLETGSRAWYLENPQQFARLYVVGRGYVLLWSLLGALVAFRLGTALSHWKAGALFASSYTLMPVVISLGHESKPHLPGSVLMLVSVYAALWFLAKPSRRRVVILSIACGLATAMIMTSVWICLLIPLVLLRTKSQLAGLVKNLLIGICTCLAVFVIFNPYILLNLFLAPEVLISNLSNSSAMYQFSLSLRGAANAAALWIQGASVLTMLLAIIGIIYWLCMRPFDLLVVGLPGIVGLVQFVGLAEGKPGEYARFAIYSIVCACLIISVTVFELCGRRKLIGETIAIIFIVTLLVPAWRYWDDLGMDQSLANSRYELSQQIAELIPSSQGKSLFSIGVLRDPAPYCFPPLPFEKIRIVKLPAVVEDWPRDKTGWPELLIIPLNGTEGIERKSILHDGYYYLATLGNDRTPISWINKPLIMLGRGR